MDLISKINIKKIRYHFQWALMFLTLYGGYRLYLFYEHFVSRSSFVERIPLVDGFLPIGALLSIKLWIKSGVIHPAHPAATIILLSALSISLLFKKSFCGWVCPICTLSELIFKLGKKIFGRNFKVHPYLDYPLRSIKYIFLGLVLYLSFILMDALAIKIFLNDTYWKIADIRMLLFFTQMSKATMIFLTVLFCLSLLFKNFWCRYLCPYGALTGLLSLLSPFKILRNEKACTHCEKCTESCPNLLPVGLKTRIRSPECNGCLTCVCGCPSKALSISFAGKKALKPLFYSLVVFIFFFGIIGTAKYTGNWKSKISYEDYKRYVPLAGQIKHKKII